MGLSSLISFKHGVNATPNTPSVGVQQEEERTPRSRVRKVCLAWLARMMADAETGSRYYVFSDILF